ncbi:MAG: hypothetical protein KA369_08555 [Spirochaetes bacterium]|nr:hypothetical protein [Spirochaetota bacterium]
MNSTIKIMLELQLYWDKVTSSQAAIEKINTLNKAMEKEIDADRAAIEILAKRTKELKSAIKQNELTLSEMSGRTRKLEDRKKVIHTEKELHALEKEIDVITFESGALEEKTLSMIDDLDAMEKELSELNIRYDEKARHHDAEKENTSQVAAGHEEIIKINTEKFNALTDQVSSLYKSKFLKMIKSRDGKGIARVEGEICGFCNFKIPSFLAIDASKEDKVVNCTNCGKFIYR